MLKIVLEKGQKLFHTSDSHYGHKNLCKGVTEWDVTRDGMVRDFDTLDQMNNAIVNNINSKVGQDDVLIHHGDWSFGGLDNVFEFRERLFCRNIYLLLGNHDHHIEKKQECRDLFTFVDHYAMIQVNTPRPDGSYFKHRSVNMHFPISSWHDLKDGIPMFFGHTHLPAHLKTGNGKFVDVGMDGNNLYPYLLEDLIKLVKNKPINNLCLPQDHHTNV